MTNAALNKILSLPDNLKADRVFKRAENGDFSFFRVKDADSLIRYFDAEQAAASVTYPAYIQFAGHTFEGFFDVHRDGHHTIRFN